MQKTRVKSEQLSQRKFLFTRVCACTRELREMTYKLLELLVALAWYTNAKWRALFIGKLVQFQNIISPKSSHSLKSSSLLVRFRNFYVQHAKETTFYHSLENSHVCTSVRKCQSLLELEPSITTLSQPILACAFSLFFLEFERSVTLNLYPVDLFWFKIIYRDRKCYKK